MPKKTKDTQDPVELEKLSEQEAEAMAHYADEPSVDASAENMDEEAEKALIVEEAADVDQAVPAELAAIHTDNESARAAEGTDTTIKKTKAKTKEASKKTKTPSRSGKYEKARAHLEVGKQYSVEEAIELVKKMSYSKFDGGVEVHLRLAKKKTKGGTESSKGQLNLPHGTGKEKEIVVLDEAKIDEIAKTKKIYFDIAIATPELMPKVAKIAKILGPKGKMPDPKSGTVTADPKKAIAEINSGKVDYRIDSTNNVHQLVGRVSWETAKLVENVQAVLAILPKSRIASAFVTASMSPAIQLELTEKK